jgi:hypothetical protein
VPLRFPRQVVPVIAAGMAATWVVAAAAPAFADQVRQQEWWLGKLNVSQAWKVSKGHGITVAVLSDGVDAAQADIAGSVTVGPDYTGSDETSSTYLGLQGTPIASLIAGRGHGPGHAAGIVGVAPQARILSVRVTLDPGDPAMDSATLGAGLPGAIAAGIRYAVAHHAKVIDLPLDPGEPSPTELAALPIPEDRTTAPELAGITAAAGGSVAERAAVDYALKKQVILIAPAGDNGAGTDAANYPAAYPGVISVGAFSQSFSRAPYSNDQTYVTMTAAGEDVEAADSTGGYATVSSTDAASAMVSGIAALIRSRFPHLPVKQVKYALTSSTLYRPPGAWKPGSGYGTADAQRALATAAALAAPTSQRAGAGALPLATPGSPGAQAVTSDALVPRVLRAAIVSAAVLVVLLVLVTGYLAISRRRERKKTAASAEWARSAQTAYSPYGASEADQMAEFFAAPTGNRSAAAGPFPQFQAAQLAGAPAARPPGDEAGAAAASAAGSGVGAWVPLGPASRGHSRQPRVSGAPPWDPASKPASELPWAAVPGPANIGLRAAGRAAVPIAGPTSEAGWPTAVSDPVWTSAGTPASEAAWTSAAAEAATQSPADQDWADLAENGAAASPARSGDDPAADDPPPFGPESAGQPDLEGRGTAGQGAGGTEPDQDAASWAASDRPRSPSGMAWETGDGDRDGDERQAADARWQLPDSDADRQPAAAAAPWELAGDGYDEPAAGESWPTADRDSYDQPAAAAEPRPSADSDAYGQPPAASPPWAPADSEPRWQLPGDGEPTSADSDPRWLPAATDSQWAPAEPADSAWPSGGSSSWQSTAADAPWERAAPADPPADDELYAWRPAAQTETFPAISDES